MLSVAAVQLSATELIEPAAPRPPGAVGATVSGVLMLTAMSACDLPGRQSSVVDAHLVDLALEPLRPDVAPAEAERPGGRGHRADLEQLRGLDAVDVDPQHVPVIGRGEMGPARGRDRGSGTDVGVEGADEHVAARYARSGAGVEGVRVVVASLLEGDRSPGAAERRRPDPRLDRHRSRQVERRCVRDGDPVVRRRRT